MTVLTVTICKYALKATVLCTLYLFKKFRVIELFFHNYALKTTTDKNVEVGHIFTFLNYKTTVRFEFIHCTLVL
jgi:hypothetical protein